MRRRWSIRARATCLLWVYAFLLLSQALHAFAPHADAAPAFNQDVPTLSSDCDGPCHDPSHHHAPAAHADHCAICKVASQAQRLAPTPVGLASDSAPGGLTASLDERLPSRFVLRSAPARAPPHVG